MIFESVMGVAGAVCGIEEVVGDDAVVLGVEAGDDGEVIGKSERGIAGDHALGSRDAALREREKVSGVVALRVVPAKSVERNQDDIMLALCPVGVGSVVDVRERQCGIEAGSLPCGRARGNCRSDGE